MPPVDPAAIGAYLRERRGAILRDWREAVSRDPALTTGAALPRAQLHDHIPALLLNFERSLLGEDDDTGRDAQAVQQGDAAAHGLHRWQQGFDLGEVTRELGRLNECVVAELEAYAVAHPAARPATLAEVRRLWARQCSEAVSASVSQYFELQQIEATAHIRDLEQALQALQDLEQQRARLWQEAAHDLRGGLGVVAAATAGLTSPRTPEAMRDSFVQLLDRNVGTLRHLLNDVTSLARLQGGLERRAVEPVDVRALLAALCDDLQPAATQRGLTLRFEAADALSADTDPVKVRRIAQNLALNAIKYTRQGGVTVRCGGCAPGDRERWFLEVRDTGPGFHGGPGSQLAGALEEATEQARQVSADHAAGAVTHAEVSETALASPQPSAADPRPVLQTAGEGIGLSIVKRLCDLLDATVEVQSEIGVGTTFRILLPRRYDEAPAA